MGKGGFGNVKLQTRNGKQMALKRYDEYNYDNPRFFLFDIDVLSKLNHPNIIYLEEIFFERNSPVLVLELGMSLWDVIKKENPNNQLQYIFNIGCGLSR